MMQIELFLYNEQEQYTYHKYSKCAEVVAFTDNGVQVSACVGAPVTDPVAFSICEQQEPLDHGTDVHFSH